METLFSYTNWLKSIKNNLQKADKESRDDQHPNMNGERWQDWEHERDCCTQVHDFLSSTFSPVCQKSPKEGTADNAYES